MFLASLIGALTISSVFGGLIKPASIPIILSRSNSGETSHYVFDFSNESRIASNAKVVVTFPPEFPIRLFEADCLAYNYQAAARTEVPCTTEARKITLNLGTLGVGQQVIGIHDVINPSSAGGTGYFWIETYQDASLIDSNGAYPGVGITEPPTDVSTILQNIGATVTSYSSTISLSTASSVSFPQGSWIRVSLPKYFTFSAGPRCLLGVTVVNCKVNQYNNLMIETEGLTSVDSVLRFTLQNAINPPMTGSTGTFLFEVIEKNSSNVLYTSSEMVGFTITPGFISGIQMQRSLPHLNTASYYYIRFRTTSNIPSGGSVVVILPEQYQGVTNCEIMSGLVPLDSVKCNYSGNQATYTEFNSFKAGVIELKIKAVNPSTTGTTDQITISTYNKDGVLIDQNLQSGTFVFSDIDQLQNLNVEMFRVKTDSAIGKYGPIEFMLETRTQLPATSGSTGGRIVLTLPDDAQVHPDYTKLQCLFGRERITSQSCTISGQVITIQTPSIEDFETCPMSVTITTLGDPSVSTQGIMLTQLGTGMQRVTIETFIDDGSGYDPKEKADYYFVAPPRITSSSSDLDSITPGSLSFVLSHYSNGGHINSLDLTYTNSLEIEAGGRLRIELPTEDNSFLRDLGLDLQSFETIDYICIEKDTLDLVSSCTLTAGTLRSPVVIDVFFNDVVPAESTLEITLPDLYSTNERDIAPSITVKNLDSDGFVVEYDTYTSENMIRKNTLTCLPDGTITAQDTNIVQEDTELVFTIPSSYDLIAGDIIFIKFPEGYIWDSSTTIEVCDSGFTAGMNTIADFEHYSKDQTHIIKFTSSAAVTRESGNFNLCMSFPNRLYSGPSTFQVLVIQTLPASGGMPVLPLQVTKCLEITTAADPDPATITPTIEYKLPDSSVDVMGTYELLYITYTGAKIVQAGSIWIQLPKTHFNIVGTECYYIKQAPAGTICTVDTSDTDYDAYILTEFGTSDSSTVFEIYMSVDIVNSPTGTGDIIITSVYDDETITTKLVEETTETMDFSSYIEGLATAEQVTLLTPYIEGRIGEFAPLVIKFTPSADIDARTDSNENEIIITLPDVVGAFVQPVGSYIYCTIGGEPASYCIFDTDAVNSLDKITLKQPSEISLVSGTEYEIVVNFIDSTDSSEIGFKWPDEPGTYRFKIEFGAALSNAVAYPTVILRPNRITGASVKSYSMSVGKPNILDFEFTITTELKKTDRSTETEPGSLYIWFPSSDWDDDLGLGVSDMSQIDCPVDSTETCLASGLECYLIKEYNGFTKIKINNSLDCSADTVYNFRIPGIINPTTSMTDIVLYISTELEDISTLTDPFITWLDFIELTYIDTTYTNSVTATTNTIDIPIVPGFVPSEPDETTDINIIFTPTVSLAEGDWILITIPPHTSLSTLTCEIDTVTVSDCKYFSNLNYLYLSLGASDSLTAGTESTITFGTLTLSSYVQTLSFVAYHYKDRELVEEITHTLDDGYFITGDVTINQLETMGSTLIAGDRNIVNIEFEMEDDIVAGGYIYWEVFDGETSATTVDTSYCQVTIETLSAGDFNCEIVTGTPNYLKISGFSATLDAGTVVKISLGVIFPAQDTYDTIIKTHNGLGFVDSVTDTGTFVVTAGDSGDPLSKFEAPDTVFYRRPYPVRPSAQVGDLDIKDLTFPSALVKNSGQVKISFDKSVSKVTDSNMRCIWTISDEDYISPSCTITSTAATTTYYIMVTAPLEVDVPANTDVDLLITSHIDGDIAGIKFDVTAEVYTVTITADDGVAGGTAFDMLWVTQLEVLPQPIEAVVTPLHTVAGEYNILDITLYLSATGCNVPDSGLGGRIVVEFPNIFDDDLGLGIDDAGLLPCSQIDTTANTATALTCYLSLGDSVNDVKPKIHISGFTDYDVTTTKLVRIEKIMNPSDSGDDQIVDLTIYLENIDTTVPGDKLCQSTLYNVMTINTSAPTVNDYNGIARTTSNSGLGVSSVGYSVDIEIPTGGYLASDILVIYLDTAATASTLTYTPDIGDLTYHATSHMAYIEIDTAQAADFTLTFTGFTSPSYQTKLSFDYLGVRAGEVIAYGTISSAANINVAVATTDISVFKENRDEIYAGEVASFIVSFKNSIQIPAGGSIKILVDDNLVAQDEMVSFYYLSEMTASFKIDYPDETVEISSVDYDTYKIYGFSSIIPQNTVTYLKLTLETPTTAADYKIIVETNYFADTDSQIETFEKAITVTNKEANPYFNWPGAYLYPVDLRAGGIGPFMMKINIPDDMSDTDNVEITLADFQGLDTDHKLLCLWDGVAADSCVYDSADETYTVGLVNEALDSGDHTLVITSKLYKDPNVSGILYPADPGTYVAKAAITIGSDTYNMARELFVLPADKFKSLKITSLNTYQNSETMLKIDFTHPTGLNSYPKLMICLPTVDENGTRVFDDDLGYDLADGSPVPCAINSSADSVSCTLKRGYGYLYQPACILAVFTVATDDNTNPTTLVLFGLKNPVTTGKLDILHIYAKLWSYVDSPTLDITVGQTYPYIYTVQSNTLTAGTDTYDLSTSTTNLSISLVLTTQCGTDDVIVIQGTNDFLYEDVTCSPAVCTYKENDIRTIYLTGLTSAHCTTMSSTGLTITVPLEDIYTLPGDLKVYSANKDAITGLYSLSITTYSQDGTLDNISVSDVTITPDNVIKGLRSWYTIEFKPSVSIPTFGCIEIDFSDSDIKPIGKSCYSTDDTDFSTKHGYTCNIASDILTITDMDPQGTDPNIAYLKSSTSAVLLRMLFINPTSYNEVTYEINIYYDNACSAAKLIQTGAGTKTLTYSSTDESTDLVYIPYQESIASTAAVSTNIDLTFTFTPPEAMTAYTDKLYIVLGNLVATNLVPSCEIITEMFTRKPAICSYDSVSLKITLTPAINLATDTEYTIKIYPKEGTLKTHATLTTTAMKIHIEIGASKYAYIDNISINGNNLENCIVTSYTTSPAIENVFKIEYKTTSAITAASDVLFVDFPTVNEYGETLFDDDLGTGYESGALLPCQCLSTLITCTLSKGDNTSGRPARVIIQFTANISASTSLEIYLVKIINPVASTAANPKVVSLAVGHLTTFNNIKSLRYVNNVFEVSTDTPTKKLRSDNTAHTGQFTGVATDTLQLSLDTTSLGSDKVQTLIIEFEPGFYTLASFTANSSPAWTIDAILDDLNIIILTQTTPTTSGTVTPLTYTGLFVGTLPYYIIDTIWSISDKGQLFSKAQHKYDKLPTYTAETAYGGPSCNDMVVFEVITTDYLNIEDDFRVMIYPLLTGFTDLDPTSLSFEGLATGDSYPEWYYDSTNQRFVMDINNMKTGFKIKYWARNSASTNAGTIKFEIADKDDLDTAIYSIASITVAFGSSSTTCTTAKLKYASIEIDKYGGQSDATFNYVFKSHVDAGTKSKVIIDITDLYTAYPDTVNTCTVDKAGLAAPVDCSTGSNASYPAPSVSNSSGAYTVTIIIPIDVKINDGDITLSFKLTSSSGSNTLKSENSNTHITIKYQPDWVGGYRTEYLDVIRMPIYKSTPCTSSLTTLGASFSSSYGPGLNLDYDNLLAAGEYVRIGLSPTYFNEDLGTDLADGAYLASFTSNNAALKCYIREGTLDYYVTRPSYIDCYKLTSSSNIYFPTIKTKSSTTSFSYEITQFGENFVPTCYPYSNSVSSLSSATCSTGTLTLTAGDCDIAEDAAFSFGTLNALKYVYITGFLQNPTGLVTGTDDDFYTNSIFPGEVFIVDGSNPLNGIEDDSFADFMNGNPNLSFTLKGQGYTSSSCTTYSHEITYSTCPSTTMSLTLSKYDNSAADYYSRTRSILSLVIDIDSFNIIGEYMVVLEFPKTIVDGIGCEFCHYKNISPATGYDISINTDSDTNNYLLKISNLGNRNTDPTFYGIYVDWKDVADGTSGVVTGKLYRGSVIDDDYLVPTTSTISITMETYSDSGNEHKLLKPSELSFRYSHFQQPTMIYSGSSVTANLSFYINFPTAVTAKTDTITLKFSSTTMLVDTDATELRASITPVSDYTLTLLASKVEYDDTTNYSIAITAPQFDLTAGLYYIQISTNDGIGFEYPADGYIKTIEFYDGTDTYKDFSYQPLYSDTVSYPFMEDATDPCLVYSASNEISEKNYINIEYPSAGLDEADSPAVVIEFPTIDVLATAMFQSNLGAPSVIVYEDSTYKDFRVEIESYQGSTTIQKLKYPTKIYIFSYTTTTALTAFDMKMMLFKVINPAVSNVVDLIIYTQNYESTSVPLFSNRKIVKGAIQILDKTLTSTPEAKSYQTGTYSATINSSPDSADTISLTLSSTALPVTIKNNDRLILEFPTEFYDITGLVGESPITFMIDAKNGYAVITNTSTDLRTIEIYGFTHLKYKPLTSSIYFIKAYLFQSGLYVKTITFSEDPPTTWVYAPLTSGTLFGLKAGKLDNLISIDSESLFAFDFDSSVDMPSGSSIVVIFPSSFTLYECNAYSGGFSNPTAATCTVGTAAQGINKWVITGFGTLGAGQDVIITGYAKTGSTAISTAYEYTVETYLTSDVTSDGKKMGEVSDCLTASTDSANQADCQVYDTNKGKSTRANFKVDWQYDIDKRMYDAALPKTLVPLVFTLQPKYSLTATTHYVQITTPIAYLKPTCTVYCMFKDLTTNISYASSSCEYVSASTAWKIFKPKDTDILNSKKYEILFFTHGCEYTDTDDYFNGFSPIDTTASPSIMVVTAVGATTGYSSVGYTYIEPIDELTVLPILIDKDGVNFFKITLKETEVITAGTMIVIEMIALNENNENQFEDDFGTGYDNYADIDCYTDLDEATPGTPVSCMLIYSFKDNTNEYAAGQIIVRNYDNVLTLTEKYIWIPLIHNPDNDEVWLDVSVKVYDFDNTVNSEKAYVVMQGTQRHLFKPKDALLSAGTPNDKNSIAQLLGSTNNIISLTSKTFTISLTETATYSATTDYVLWKMPHEIINTGLLVDGSAPLALFPNIGYFITPGKSTSANFVFTVWNNPDYAIAANTAESWHTKDQQVSLNYKYNQGTVTYTPEEFDDIAAGVKVKVTTLSGGLYSGYYDQFYVEVMKDSELTGGYYTVTLPASFSDLSTTCLIGNNVNDVQAIDSTKASCTYSSRVYTISNLDTVRAYTEFKVMFWGKITGTTASDIVVTYYEGPDSSYRKYESKYSATAVVRAVAGGQIVSPVQRSSYSPLRLNNRGWLYFQAQFDTAITEDTGYVNIQFETGLMETITPTNSQLRCTWDNGTNTYSAKSCSFATDALTIYAPLSTDIAEDIEWTITIFTVFNSGDDEGLKVVSASDPGYHTAVITTYPDGSTATEKSTAYFFIPPTARFTKFDITPASTTTNAITNLKFDFKSSAAIEAGLEAASGTTELVIEFSEDWDDNIAEFLVSTYPLKTLVGDSTDYKLYIQETNDYAPTQIIVRGFDAIALDTAFDFTIYGLKHPNVVKIPPFKAYTRKWTDAVYSYIVYTEVRYPYKITSSTPTTATGQTIAYTDQKFDTTTTATLNVKTAADLASGNILFFRYTSDSPSIESVTLTSPSHTMTILQEYNMIMIELTAAATTINTGDGVDFVFGSMPNPSYPITATWELYVISGGIVTDINTYSDVTYTADTTTTATIDYRDYYLSSHTPAEGLTYEMVVSITPGDSIDQIPKGGSVVINLVDFVNSPSECVVEHGLWPYECTVTGSQIKLTGFEEYLTDGTQSPIVVSFLYTVATADATETPAVNVEIYADESISGSKIEGTSADATADFTFDAAETYLPNTSIQPVIQFRTEAGLGIASEIIIKLKTTSTDTDSTHYMKITPPTGYSIPTDGVLECWFSDDTNQVPSECSNDSTNGFIKVSIPTQLSLETTTELNLIIRVRDTADLTTDGIVLPLGSDILDYSDPYSNLPFYIELYDVDDTLLEAEKILLESYGESLATFTVKPAHYNLNTANLFDIEFKASSTLNAGGYIEIEFPTHDGTNQIWDVSMGLEYESEDKINCYLMIGGTYDSTAICTLIPASSTSTSTPVVVKVTGYAEIAADSVCKLTLIKLYNPINSAYEFESAVDLKISVKMMAYDIDSPAGTLIAQGVDYDVFKGDLNSDAPEGLDIDSVTTTTATVCTEFLSGNGLVITFTNGNEDINDGNDYLIIELEDTFTIPTPADGAIICTGFGTTCTAISYPIANWIVVTSDGGNTNGSITLESGSLSGNPFKSPDYSKTSYSVKVIVIAENVWTETFTGSLPELDPAIPTVTIASLNDVDTLNTYALYTITITRATTTDLLDRIIIEFPSEYQWIDSECDDITGLEAVSSLNPISCKSDCNTEDCTNMITVLNFNDEDPTTDIVITIGAMTPSSSTVADTFTVTLYGSTTDDSIILEQDLAIPDSTTYTEISYPLDVWMDWVVEDIYDRAVRAGQIGEIYVKFKPTYFQDGLARLHLPEGFDIAIGGIPYCEIAQGDMPFDNYPTYPDRSYRHIPAKSCTFSNRVITITLPDETLREYYGLDPNKCTYFILTTTGASVNGFRAPWNPGYYDVKLQFFSDSNNIVEYSSAEIYIPGIDPPQLDIIYDNSVTGSDSLKTIYSFNFITDRVIPRGYEYTYLGSIQPSATIEIQFDTFESFDVDLGNGYQSGSDAPCYVVKGLVAKTGESIICKFTAGDTSVFRPTPSKISITNFESIASGVEVEIHIPRITNPTTDQYKPRLGLGIYQIDSNQRVTWIYQITYQTLDKVEDLAIPAVTDVNIDATVTSSTVGMMNTLTLPFDTDTSDLNVGDSIVIVFPEEWGTIQTGFTVTILQSTNLVDSPSTLTYTNNGVIRLTLSSALASSTSYSIVLSNIRNPIYEIECTDCGIIYYSISSYKFKHIYTTKDISQAPISITAAGLIRNSISFSSYSGEDVNVTILVTMEPEIKLNIGSEMTFYLATSIPNIYERPNPSCSVSPKYLSCAIVDRGVKITGFKGNAIEITTLTIYGSKNPGRSSILSSSNGMRVEVKDETSYRTLYYEFPDRISILSEKSPTELSYSIIPEFLSGGITCNYNIRFSSSTLIYPNSSIIITFPSGFTIPVNIECIISGSLSSFASCISSSNTVTVVLNKEVPANGSVYLTLIRIKSPTVSTESAEFSSFSITIVNDGTTIGASSSSDPNSKLILYKSPEAITLSDNSFYPSNRGEYATYDIQLRVPVTLPKSSTSIIVDFPEQYSDNLIPYDMTLICTSNPAFSQCADIGNRRIKLSGSSMDITSNTSITISLFGIANPSSIGTGNQLIFIYNETTSRVIAYIGNAGAFGTSSGAKQMNLNSVEFSSLNTNTKLDVSFNFSIGDYDLNSNDKAIWVDWPTQFASAFTENSYDCDITVGDSAAPATCTWLENTDGFRTEVKGISNLPNGASNAILKFYSLPPPSSSGSFNNFSLRTFDDYLNIVLERSFNNLATNIGATFAPIGFSISTPKLLNVRKGFYSDEFRVTLSSPSFNGVTVTPKSDVFTFSPENLTFRYAWNTSQTMRVLAPSSMKNGRYIVTWETSDSLYSPPLDLVVVVVDSTASLSISIDTIPSIPQGTTTPLIALRLERAPIDPLSVNFSFLDKTQTDLFKFNPSPIVFESGESVKYFNITALEGASTTSIRVIYSGASSDKFKPQQDSIEIEVLPLSVSPIYIRNAIVQKISPSSATIKFFTTGSGILYYVYSLKGVPEPTYNQILNKNIIRNDVKAYYGEEYTHSNSKQSQVILSDLEYNTEYVLYATPMSLSNIFSQDVETITFKTTLPQTKAQFKVYTTSIIPTTRVIDAVAATLALPSSYFKLTGIDPELYNGGRRLKSEFEYEYELALEIPDSLGLDPPVKLLRSLDLNISTLKSYLPELDTTKSIGDSISISSLEFPAFRRNPILVNVYDESVVISASLNLDGLIGAVALPQGSPQPTSRQVMSGMDSTNKLVPSGNSATVEAKDLTASQLTLTNLTKGDTYDIWLSAKNSGTLVGELMDDDLVIKITIQIPKEPEVENTSKNLSWWNLSILCLILSLII